MQITEVSEMCTEHEHWCSACGSKVDKKEAVFLDFMVKKDGTMENKRTVICARCMADPKVKEMVDEMRAIASSEAPKLPKKEKEKRAVGEMGCGRCGKLIKEDTPTVALTVMWDCETKRFDEGTFILCKECYNEDEKTRKMWQYLAKLGKNPTFTPRITCGASHRCATHQRSKNPAFNCRHIAVVQTRGGVFDRNEFRLACNRGHPKMWNIETGDPHLFPGAATKLSTSKAGGRLMTNPRAVKAVGIATTNPYEEKLKKLKKILSTANKKMDKAVEKVKDPGQRAVLKAQVESSKALFALLGGPGAA